MPGPAQRVAVIGAGAAGLSAARHLLEDGHDVTVYEIGSKIGGLWVQGNDNGRSVAYDSLHINSEPRVTSYRGFPFPPDTSVVPSHQEVAAYLNDFADRFGIRERIRFHARVVSVSPVADRRGDGWLVTTEDGPPEPYDDVVVAVGHQGTPVHPAWHERFEGRYLHSHEYREPLVFTGERVLVVGVGNSGLDIAADIAPVASQTYVAARSPVLIMPRMMFGVPTARVLARLQKPYLPWVVQRQIMRVISRVYHGRMEQWGLRTPVRRTHPASNATFMAHVAYRRILCRPGVAAVSGHRVTFTDGDSVEVDTIVAATGYDIDIPFLPPHVSPVVDRRVDLHRRVVHPSWPGLFFVGFFNVSGGANIAMMDTQAAWVSSVVSGRSVTPSEREMRRSIARERRRLARRFPHAPRYGLELEPRPYKRAVAAEIERRPEGAPVDAGR